MYLYVYIIYILYIYIYLNEVRNLSIVFSYMCITKTGLKSLFIVYRVFLALSIFKYCKYFEQGQCNKDKIKYSKGQRLVWFVSVVCFFVVVTFVLFCLNWHILFQYLLLFLLPFLMAAIYWTHSFKDFSTTPLNLILVIILYDSIYSVFSFLFPVSRLIAILKFMFCSGIFCHL